MQGLQRAPTFYVDPTKGQINVLLQQPQRARPFTGGPVMGPLGLVGSGPRSASESSTESASEEASASEEEGSWTGGSEEDEGDRYLIFQGASYQKQHRLKRQTKIPDADVVLLEDRIIGVCDGVSQMVDYGVDPRDLPRELMDRVSEFMPEHAGQPGELPAGAAAGRPGQWMVDLLVESFNCSASKGATTVLTAGLAGGQLVVLNIGDCVLLQLRRAGPGKAYQRVFVSETQRYAKDKPWQVGRLEKDTDGYVVKLIQELAEISVLDVEHGDVIVAGTDGVFDNLFEQEVLKIANAHLHSKGGMFSSASTGVPTQAQMDACARAIVTESLAAATYPDTKRQTPYGPGGKPDDTACVVAVVHDFTSVHALSRNSSFASEYGPPNAGSCETCRAGPKKVHKPKRAKPADDAACGTCRLFG